MSSNETSASEASPETEPWAIEMLTALSQLIAVARRDEEARAALESLGRALALIAAPSPAAAPAESPSPAEETPSEAPASVADMFRKALGRGLAEADQPTAPEVAAPTPAPVPQRPPAAPPVPAAPATSVAAIDLNEVRDLMADFQRKAAAAEWCAHTRANGLSITSELPPDLQAGLSHRQLWFAQRETLHLRPERAYRQLEGLYRTLARALDYLLLSQQVRDPLYQPLQFLAEAQSALRLAAHDMGDTLDPDQERVHRFLRFVTNEFSVYLPRFMKLSDPGDPERWQDMADRIDAAAAPARERIRRERDQREARSRLDYHLAELAAPGGADAAHHWAEAFAAIEVLIDAGMLQPSDRALRERLLPVLDERPAGIEVGEGVALVFREIDRYLARLEEHDTRAPEPAAPSQDVLRVADVLAGRSIVFIGGEPRVEHKDRIERVFRLREMIWLEGYGKSYRTYEPPIARDDVAIVVLALRWASHETMNVQTFCDQYHKPLITLKSGYNANQLAAQVLAQAGNRLGA